MEFFNLSWIEISRKSRNPGDQDRDMKTSKKSRLKIPKSRESGSGYEKLEKFSRKSRTNPENPKMPGIRVFLVSGFLSPGFGILFRGMGYPDEKPTLLIIVTFEWGQKRCDFLGKCDYLNDCDYLGNWRISHRTYRF